VSVFRRLIGPARAPRSVIQGDKAGAVVAPTVTAAQVFSIAEGMAIGSVVGKVAWTGSGLTIAAITGPFAIDTGGWITTTAIFDYETIASYTPTVTLTNGAGADAKAITVNVTDVAAPVAQSGQSFSIAENATVGDLVGTVALSSGTATAWAITSGNTGTAFSINSSGEIRVAAALDYETLASYTLGVRPTGGTEVGSSVNVGITITDIDEGAIPADNAMLLDATHWYRWAGTGNGAITWAIPPDPPIIVDDSGSVDEDASIGTLVGTFPNTGGLATGVYITGGNTGTAFAATLTDGGATVEIRTAATLDYETLASYTLLILIENAGGSQYDTADYSVTVNDVVEGGGGTFPIDALNGATELLAAGGTRRLRAAYSGSAIRVKETGGNTEADIGFDGDDLDETALLAHCGSNDGIVTKIYGQNPSSPLDFVFDGSPKIVEGGVITKLNGKPIISMGDFGGFSAQLPALGASAAKLAVTMMVKIGGTITNNWRICSAKSAGTGSFDYQSSVNGVLLQCTGTPAVAAYRDPVGLGGEKAVTANTGHALSSVFDGTNMQVFVDGSGGTTTAVSSVFASSDLNIGLGSKAGEMAGSSTVSHNCHIGEFYVLGNIATGDRALLEDDYSTYFGI
jgi:hypothetical protein